MNTNMFWKSLITFVISVMLTACGGGGSSDPAPPVVPPPGGDTTTYTISGTANPGTKVALSKVVGGTPSLKGEVSADATGAWKFTSLATGQYTVVPSLAGHSCDPASLTKDVNNADWTNITFTCTPNPTPRNISGWIRDGVGAGVAGVTVSMSPGGSSTQTLADGSYSVGGLNPVQYTVTPSSPLYTFNPLNQTVDVAAIDAVNVDFVATANTIPTRTTGTLFYPAAGTQISGSVAAMKDLSTEVVTDLWGGTPVVEGYTVPVTPFYAVPSRDGTKAVTQGSNTNGLWVVNIATKAAFQATSGNNFFDGECTGWADGAYDISPDAGYAIFSVYCATGASFTNGQMFNSVVIQKLDGSMVTGSVNGMRVAGSSANLTDRYSSPVFGSIDLATGYVTNYFIKKDASGAAVYMQVINPATGTRIGAQTLVVDNVVDGFRALSCSPDNCSRLAFVRNIGGTNHILIKDLATAVETVLDTGESPYWGTDRILSLHSVPCVPGDIVCWVNGPTVTLMAINPVDGTKELVPVPANLTQYVPDGSLASIVLGF